MHDIKDKSSPHAGGEEWRDMEVAGVYEPDDRALAAARRNIERIRQRDVTLRLVDRAGEPLVDLPVKIELGRHDFPFGDNLWKLDMMHRDGLWDTPAAAAHRQRFAEVFNAANALCYWTERPRNHAPKTEDQQGNVQYEHFARCVEWARGEGMVVKGHPLFWSIPKCIPDWLKRYDYDTQMKFVEVRVRSLVARFRDKVTLWDAVNEALWEPAFRNLPDRHWPHIEPTEAMVEYIAPVLRWAREESPAATLTVNDYGLEPGRRKDLCAKDGTVVTDALQRQRFVALANALREAGAPADALGLQAHTSGFLGGSQWHGIWDEMSAAATPLHITEFWVPRDIAIDDEDEREAMKAAYACDVLTLAFGHPAIEAFFFWGFMGQSIRWDRRGSGGSNSGHDLLPMFEAVRGLIHDEWATCVKAKTDAQGVVEFRGFTGDYTVSYPAAGPASAGPERALPITVAGQSSNELTLTAI